MNQSVKKRRHEKLTRRRRQNGVALARSRLAAFTAFLAVAISLGVPGVCGQEGPSEYQVKAAFLFDFGKFIQWPDSSFWGSYAPFSICVLGQDPFGDALKDLRGKFIGQHPVTVWRIKSADAGGQCQVLFVSASEKSHLDAIFRTLRGSNALLVGDTPGFAESGGAIEFTLQEKHVHFTINPDAMQRAELRANSQLLALAKIVHDGKNEGKN